MYMYYVYFITSILKKVIHRKRERRAHTYVVPPHLKAFVKSMKYSKPVSAKSLFQSDPTSKAIHKYVMRVCITYYNDYHIILVHRKYLRSVQQFLHQSILLFV